MKTNIQFGAASHIGRVRRNNEDSFGAEPELGLYVVSDGMGGAASGEVASRMTVETMLAHWRRFSKRQAEIPGRQATDSYAGDAGNRLAGAIRAANLAVRDAALLNPTHFGMGATVVAVHVDGERLSIAHVGDSRAYRLRRGELELLTRDHSMAAEQVRHGLMSAAEAGGCGLQSVLLRAVGLETDVEVEIGEEMLLPGDVLLLCSDGLTRELPDEVIAAALDRPGAAQEKAQECAQVLVDLANEAGGNDNITALVLRSSARTGSISRLGRWLFGAEQN